MIKLIYGKNQPDIRYATGFSFSDEVFFIDSGKEKYLYLDNRELAMFKGKRGLRFKALSLDPFITESRKVSEKVNFRSRLAFNIVRSIKPLPGQIIVSKNFPVGMADYLRSKGVKLAIADRLYPKRLVKTLEEVRIIKGILKKIQKAFRHVEKILEESKINGKNIVYKGRLLTSEFLKKEIDLIFVDQGLVSLGGIVSSGADSSIPHHKGAGKIKPHTPIIVDLFPQDKNSGYFGDMTRTYIKGRPSHLFKKIYNAVLEAKDGALGRVRDGTSADEVHRSCVAIFEKNGFQTKNSEGFIHATGHGLGLEIHEEPLVGYSKTILKAGNIITIEPGLYYKNIGGVRIEDVVLVTKEGCKNLTNYPDKLRIL